MGVSQTFVCKNFQHISLNFGSKLHFAIMGRQDKENTQSTSMGLTKKPSAFEQAFLSFLSNGSVGNPVQSPLPRSSEPEPGQLPGKKKYIPPYTPERTPVKPPNP